MTVLPATRPTEDLAHLAWCAMVAVSLARQEGKVVSSLQTHMFIMQWLSTAQKRKVFPRSLAQDILWLQAQGKRHGPAARLYSKLEYVWLASAGELASQSTLFRFTYMIDTLRTLGWQDHLLSEDDWRAGWKTGAETPAVYTRKSLLHISFTQAGKLQAPLEIRLSGNVSDIYPLLEQAHLQVESTPLPDGGTLLSLLPDLGL